MSGLNLCEYMAGILIPLCIFSVVDRPSRSAEFWEGVEPSGGSPRTPFQDLGQHAPSRVREKPEAVPTSVNWEASKRFDGFEAGKNLLKHKG